jgi:hypothetical protein
MAGRNRGEAILEWVIPALVRFKKEGRVSDREESRQPFVIVKITLNFSAPSPFGSEKKEAGLSRPCLSPS